MELVLNCSLGSDCGLWISRVIQMCMTFWRRHLEHATLLSSLYTKAICPFRTRGLLQISVHGHPFFGL